MFHCSRRGTDYEEIVVAPNHPGVELWPSHQNEENEDFSNRLKFHQTATVLPPSQQDPNMNSPADIQILR